MIALCGCASVSLRNAFPAPSESGKVVGVIVPVEDRSGSHGVAGFEPSLAEVFAQALRLSLSHQGVPTALAESAPAPWQAPVPAGAQFILAARINELSVSMRSEGVADVDYAVYAPGKPAALRSWTVHTSHARSPSCSRSFVDEDEVG
ncbi:MAG: hypothetical protein ABR567_21695 [Myxococcales bacterium]|nr:hypothetical protein [Myxococcales bacterium]